MPQKTLTYLSPADLKPYEKNPRINDGAVEAVKRSLVEFGFQNPIIADKKLNVIAGHTRLKAAQALGLKEVPVLIADKLTPAQIKAYRIADNQTGNIAKWDFELLPLEIAELEADGFDVSLLGFPDDELGRITQTENEGLTDPDEIPEAPEAVTKPGDLWLLEEHRLLCGDSTRAEDVARVMGGSRAELCFTSPPYSDMRDYTGESSSSIENLSGIFRAGHGFVNFWMVNLGIKFKNDEVVQYWDQWISAAKEAGLRLLSWNVWDRMEAGSIAQQSRMFAIYHEWIFCFGVKSKAINRTVEKNPASLERLKHCRVSKSGQKLRAVRQQDGSMRDSPVGLIYDKKNLGTVVTCVPEKTAIREDHPATYPVQLPSIHIEAMTDTKQIVFDPFLGSGTTLIAAEQLNRKCYGLEISPLYCDVICKRWEQFTGKKAVLEKV